MKILETDRLLLKTFQRCDCDAMTFEAALAILDYAFKQLNLIDVVSFTVSQNKVSRRVMEKIGLRHSSDDDFEHPKPAKDSPLCRHVLYRISKDEYIKQRGKLL